MASRVAASEAAVSRDRGAELPEPLRPVRMQSLGGIEVAVAVSTFRHSAGAPLGDSYGRKSVLDYRGKPAFAELAVLSCLREAGWDGVWIDTFRKRWLRSYWSLEAASKLPAEAGDLLARISSADPTARPWDIFCRSSRGVNRPGFSGELRV